MAFDFENTWAEYKAKSPQELTETAKVIVQQLTLLHGVIRPVQEQGSPLQVTALGQSFAKFEELSFWLQKALALHEASVNQEAEQTKPESKIIV